MEFMTGCPTENMELKEESEMDLEVIVRSRKSVHRFEPTNVYSIFANLMDLD